MTEQVSRNFRGKAHVTVSIDIATFEALERFRATQMGKVTRSDTVNYLIPMGIEFHNKRRLFDKALAAYQEKLEKEET